MHKVLEHEPWCMRLADQGCHVSSRVTLAVTSTWQSALQTLANHISKCHLSYPFILRSYSFLVVFAFFYGLELRYRFNTKIRNNILKSNLSSLKHYESPFPLISLPNLVFLLICPHSLLQVVLIMAYLLCQNEGNIKKEKEENTSGGHYFQIHYRLPDSGLAT